MKRIFSRPSVSSLIGFALVLLGFMVMTGWAPHVPTFITVPSQFVNMTFNAAFCFFMAGVALVSLNFTYGPCKILFLCAISGMFLVSGFTFLEYVLGYLFGVDHLFTGVWLLDQNPHLRHMAVNTTIAFLLASIAFFLLAYTKNTIQTTTH